PVTSTAACHRLGVGMRTPTPTAWHPVNRKLTDDGHFRLVRKSYWCADAKIQRLRRGWHRSDFRRVRCVPAGRSGLEPGDMGQRQAVDKLWPRCRPTLQDGLWDT